MNSIARIAAVLALALCASAGARPPDAPAGTIDTIADHLRRDLRPHQERTRVTERGRQDLELDTGLDWNAALGRYKDAYRRGVVLADGVTVKGYFVNEAKRYATVTLNQGSADFVLEFQAAPDGTRFTLWGKRMLTYEQAIEKTKREQKSGKRPFHTGYPKARVMRYRL